MFLVPTNITTNDYLQDSTDQIPPDSRTRMAVLPVNTFLSLRDELESSYIPNAELIARYRYLRRFENPDDALLKDIKKKQGLRLYCDWFVLKSCILRCFGRWYEFKVYFEWFKIVLDNDEINMMQKYYIRNNQNPILAFSERSKYAQNIF